MTLAIAVTGATGRLGGQIVEIIQRHPEFRLHAAMNSNDSPDAMLGADVLIDATNYEASRRLVSYAVQHGLDAVVATSGWNRERIDEFAHEMPSDRRLLVVPNFSVGSVVAGHLAAIAGQFFDSVEIIEAHHEHKVDSPSGTAVRTAEAIAQAQGGAADAPFSDQPARGQLVAGIPVHSLRLRGVVADQQVVLGGDGEVVTIRHETLSPQAYEQGVVLALRRVRHLAGVTVGLNDLLGLAPIAGADSTEMR